MSNPVALCNIALQKLGADRISSLDDPQTTLEALCADTFPIARDCVLEEHTWAWASKRVILDPAGPASEWGDDFEFQVPPDVLMVARLYRSPSGELMAPATWQRMGDKVYASESEVYAEVVERITDVTKYPRLVQAAIATRIAAELCMTLTESSERETALWREYAIKVREAVASDGLQGRREVVKATRLTGARRRV